MSRTCLLSILLVALTSVQCHELHRRQDAAATADPVVGQSSTPCPMICPMIWFPVCGSDGKTYGNTCNMQVDACLSGKTITVAKQGQCDDSSSNLIGPL